MTVFKIRDMKAEIERLYEEIERLRAAAERVCRFDWSGNDNDALAAVDALRRALDERSE